MSGNSAIDDMMLCSSMSDVVSSMFSVADISLTPVSRSARWISASSRRLRASPSTLSTMQYVIWGERRCSRAFASSPGGRLIGRILRRRRTPPRSAHPALRPCARWLPVVPGSRTPRRARPSRSALSWRLAGRSPPRMSVPPQPPVVLTNRGVGLSPSSTWPVQLWRSLA